MQYTKVILFCLLQYPYLLLATDISIGVVGTQENSPYDDKVRDYTLLPVINYDDDTWFIDGFDMGYYLINNDKTEFSIKFTYNLPEYDASEGRTPSMRLLNDRRDTYMGGLSYQRTTSIGAFQIQLQADTLNHSKGVSGTLAYLALLPWRDYNFVVQTGAYWNNAQQNRYFYGITPQESARSLLPRYEPSSSVNPFFSFIIDYPITSHWEIYLNNEVQYLPKTVRQSPMVVRNVTYSIDLGFNYNF